MAIDEPELLISCPSETLVGLPFQLIQDLAGGSHSAVCY